MRHIFILIISVCIIIINGAVIRDTRQTDSLTNALEAKLLRSNLRSISAFPAQDIPKDKSDDVAYSLPTTFIIKQKKTSDGKKVSPSLLIIKNMSPVTADLVDGLVDDNEVQGINGNNNDDDDLIDI